MVTSVGFSIEGMAGPGSGAWRRFELVTDGLVSAGLEVHVSGDAEVHEAAHNRNFSSVTLARSRRKLDRLTGRSKRIGEFAGMTGADVVHVEAPPYFGSPNIPTIASVHDLRHLLGLRIGGSMSEVFYQRHVLKSFRPNIIYWLALSDWGRQEMIELLGIPEQQVVTVPPIILAPPNKINRNSTRAYVLALGHLEPRKNLEVLIRAAGSREWPAGLELWLAGADHGSLGSLRTLANDLRVNVRFLGPVSEAEKWELLVDASIVAVPSIIEGFGIVAVEAPLSGTVALVSNASGLAELAGHPFARIPWNSPSAWAAAITALCETAELHDEILTAQLECARSFLPEAVIPKLSNLYRRVTLSA